MNEKIKVRTLNTEDLFTLIDMSKDMNVSDIVDKIINIQKLESEKYKGKKLNEAERNEAFSKTGIKAALMIIQNLGNAKEKFYKLLSDVTSLKVEEVKKLPMMDTIGIIIQIFNQEEFQDFLSEMTSKA